MKSESVDFSLISGHNTEERIGHPIVENYDHSFATWLVAVRGYDPHNAKLAAYRMKAACGATLPQTTEEAEALGARIMLDAKLAKSTKRGYLYSIERWMEYLGVTVKFAHKPRGRGKCPNYLNQDQLRNLIHAAKDYREFAVLSTFIYTGARLNEVRNIDIGDIDFVQKHILIRVAKRDKERFVPLDPALERVLRAYIARLPQEARLPDSPLITTGRGGRIGEKWLGEVVRRAGRRIGLQVHPHMLRHSFASAWVENGGDVFNLQTILGHTDIGMTRRYWHFNQKAMRNAWERGAPKL